MAHLSKSHCVPCTGKTKPLNPAQIEELLSQTPNWHLSDGGKALARDFLMKDFQAASDLIKAITPIAEAEDHHPDLHLTGYRHLRIVLSTHSLGGLSQNDFILAAKIDCLRKDLKTN